MEHPVLPSTHIRRVAVVVPARNEEKHIGRALHAIRYAADLVQASRPEVSVGVVVVLDSCRDDTAKAVAETVGDDDRFVTLSAHLRSAGASRALGALAALSGRVSGAVGTSGAVSGVSGAVAPIARVWLANTDADSVVPPHWLCGQLDLAEAGFDAVVGTVEPDPEELDPVLLRRWLRHHPFVDDHEHVYGANLGVRASTYVDVGGFDGVRTREDRLLVEKLRSKGARIASTDAIRVLTSGRLDGRAPQGFAGYLRRLGETQGAGVEVIVEPAT